ncbi:hypothetical protein ACFL0G_02230 [Candidatus Zixiibacteriota bacterium]
MSRSSGIFRPIFWAIVSVAILCPLPAGADHGLAVLPFEDNSGFKGHWDLGAGIPLMLAARLNQIEGYSVAVEDSCAILLEPCPEEPGPGDLTAMFDTLRVGYVICGTVEEYGIGRFGIASPAVGGYQSYRAKAEVDFSLWERDAVAPRFEGRAIGELKQRGLGLTLWGKPSEQMEEFEILDQLAFGSEDFMNSIAGKAVDSLMTDLVNQIVSALPPRNDLSSEIGQAVVLTVEDEQIYLNRGLDDGIKVGDEFDVYTQGEELRDPESGQLLGHSDRRVGRIRVSFIKAAHLSRCEVIEGSGNIAVGDMVRSE